MRALALLILLGACSQEAPGDPLPQAATIECALAGSGEFTPDCTLERDARGELKMVIVRHPDGGFRRLEVGVEGRGIVAADGADIAVVTQGDGVAEVAIGQDRYRLPIAQ